MFGKFMIFVCLIGSWVGSDLIAAASDVSSNGNQNDSRKSRFQERSAIINENQVDDTDIYAIPYDDSEVENEEELDQLEGKKFQPRYKNSNNNRR